MHYTVDGTRCQGHGLCIATAPGLFDLDADGFAHPLTDDASDVVALDRARESCPENAISNQEEHSA